MIRWLSFLPPTQWLPDYREYLPFDVAGETLAGYAIPVSLPYATACRIASRWHLWLNSSVGSVLHFWGRRSPDGHRFRWNDVGGGLPCIMPRLLTSRLWTFLVGVRLLPGQSVALGVVILSIIAATLAVLAGVVLTALADLSELNRRPARSGYTVAAGG